MPLLGRNVYEVRPGPGAKLAQSNDRRESVDGGKADSGEKENRGALAPAQQLQQNGKHGAALKKDVFVMRVTGEVFESYEDYLAKLKQYLNHQWTCRVTGEHSLTFEEACLSEAHWGPHAAAMPETHVGPALRLVHHSLANVEDVVKKVVSTFRVLLVPGEAVTHEGQEYSVVGEVACPLPLSNAEEGQPAAAGAAADAKKNPKKAVYELKGKAEDGVGTIKAPRDEIKRAKHPLDKLMVRKWLHDVAASRVVYDNKPNKGARKRYAWIAHAALRKAHALAEDLPGDLSYEPVESKKVLAARAAKAAREEATRKRKLEKEAEKKEKEAKRVKLAEESKKRKLEKEREKRERKELREKNPNATTLKRGSMKFAAWQVLRAEEAGKGLSVTEIMAKSQEQGWRDFSETHAAYNKLFGSLCSAPQLFTKVSAGHFALNPAAAQEGAAVVVIEGPKTPDERLSKGGKAGGNGANGANGNKENDSADPAQPKETSMVRAAKASVQKWEEKVAKAEQVAAEATEQVEKQSKERPKKVEVPPELIWNPALEEFTGDAYDRKAVVGHKKWVDQEKQRLAHEAEQYVKQHKQQFQKRKQASKQVLLKATADLAAAKEGLRKALKSLTRAQSLSLVKAGKAALAKQLTKDKDLQKELEKQRVLEERRQKKLEEKEKARLQREKEKEERLRMKEVEKLERKFPLEDHLLVVEINKLKEADLPVDLPADLPTVDAAVDPGFVQLCSISACLSTFGKMLGMQPVKFEDLVRAVKLPGQTLAGLYRDLLSILLLDGSQHPSGLRRIRRWVYAMTSEWGALVWPDVLARYILTKPNVDASVIAAAKALQEKEYQSVPWEDHAALLQFLLDDVVETRTVHEEIDKWQEERLEFVAQKREDKMEQRRKERSREEAAREKRRKAEEERREKKEAFEKLKAEMLEKGEDVSAMQMEVDGEGEDERDLDEQEERERFQIPEEKLVYSGDEYDRKGVLAHRKWVEQEKQRLAREYEEYKREKGKKLREQQQKLRKEREALEAEAQLHAKKQEALDRELAKRPIRLNPLGMDRNKFKFFWNVAGQRSAIYVQHPESGEWAHFSDEATLDAFLTSLDWRGKRERGLRKALEKRLGSIRSGFRGQQDKSKEKGSPPTRASSRLSRQAANGHGGGSRVSFSSVCSEDSDVLDTVDDSLNFLTHELESVALMADKSGIPYVARDGEEELKWKVWFQEVREDEEEEGSSPLEATKTHLLSLEHAIWSTFPNPEEIANDPSSTMGAGASASASGFGGMGTTFAASALPRMELEQMENSSSDEEVDERSLEGYARMRRKMRQKLVWFSNGERDSWQEMVRTAKTVSSLAYCASTLSQRLVIVQRKAGAKAKKLGK